ncbi:Chemotaxis protein methyltransferase CheR [Minicystis rosea]|nr:Chemotaxis protein methyltransferase CheR [Minicystis rosea]
MLLREGQTYWLSSQGSSILQGMTYGPRPQPSERTSSGVFAQRSEHSEDERFRLVVETIRDYAIFWLDPDGRVASWNAGAERLKGYRAEEIIGRHFSLFYTAEDVAASKCERVLEAARREGRFEEDGWRVRKDGSHFWANIVVTALRDEAGQLLGFAKVVRDLTERRRAEEERLRLAQAHEAQRITNEFLATISHELRTPLTAILGWARLLEGGHAMNPAAVSKAMATIRRNAEAQARLIDDLLDASRIITGKMRIDVKPADMAAIVREAMDVVRPAAGAKQIDLSIERFDEPAVLVGDAGRLQQIVWNLLSNAVKFTDPGGAVRVCLKQEGGCIHVAVEDTGRGIDPAFLPHVFERFRQADASTTRQSGGLGLGLAIVRHLAELHGGIVRAESAGRDRGATFHLILPVRAVFPADAEPRPTSRRRAEHRVHTRVTLDGRRVLVVDDEPDAREVIAALLDQHGAIVKTAASASEARHVFVRWRPDVLVSDIAMPDQDGYALIQSIRALRGDDGGATPAIALTAYAREEDRKLALASGFTAHVAKPVQPAELLQAICAASVGTRR